MLFPETWIFWVVLHCTKDWDDMPIRYWWILPVINPPIFECSAGVDIEILHWWQSFCKSIGDIGPIDPHILCCWNGVEQSRSCAINAICKGVVKRCGQVFWLGLTTGRCCRHNRPFCRGPAPWGHRSISILDGIPSICQLQQMGHKKWVAWHTDQVVGILICSILTNLVVSWVYHKSASSPLWLHWELCHLVQSCI